MSFTTYPYRLLAKWVTDDPEAWIALGNAETRWLKKRLRAVERPVYVTGLARAGTTILTEALATHPDVATHTYRDFPCLFTPYFWNRTLSAFDWLPMKTVPRERAHQDGIQVTPKSPEAMEEMLWAAFFKHLHNESRTNVLGASTSNPAFEAFYSAHIAKLLYARKRTRYVAKANYNLTRLAYLARLFSDARMLIVVRDPAAHVWSLYRTHRLFCSEQEKDPAALRHTDQSGHFEFGLHRSLIHTGDTQAMQSVLSCFAAGDEIRGWARYWAMIHRFIRDACASMPSVQIVRHNDLCGNPLDTLQKIFAHADLRCDDAILSGAAYMLQPVKKTGIPTETLAIIHDETAEIAACWDLL